MDAALQLVRARPAPARSSSSGRDRPRARDAADRTVAGVVQRVVRDLVHLEYRPRLAFRPSRRAGAASRRRSAPTTRSSASPRGSATGRAGSRRSRRRTARAPAISGSTLRTWQQRSGFALPEVRPLALVLLGDRDHLRLDQLEAVALDERVTRLVALAEEELRVELDDVDRRARARRPCGRARTTASATSRSGRASRRTRVGPREQASPPTSPRSRRQGVPARSPQEHLLQRVAAEPEPQRLERDHLVGRDVAEVHLRAELLHEPRLRRSSSAPRRSGRRRRPRAAISSTSSVRISPDGRRCRRCRPRAPR